MKIGGIHKEVINEASGHKYGCVMLLSPEKDFWDSVIDSIDDEDVYDPEGDRSYGKTPLNEVHVTILYGLHSDIDDKDIEELISKMSAPSIELNVIGIFDNSNSPFDVVKFDVKGEELFEMNKMFTELPHTTDFPEYSPHCTISYVKKGTGVKYIKSLGNGGLKLKPNKVVYSKANGEEKEYKL